MSKDSSPYADRDARPAAETNADFSVVVVDQPAPHVNRVTLNRPEKRNALNHALRGELLQALQQGDMNPDVHVQIVRGAGKCFSAGYDLGGGNEGLDYPFYTAGGDGQWPRHVTDGWMSIWDMAKPVIAQVHGYCLAGGSELATGCDLVYMAEDAQMGYPAVRFGVPDMHFHPWLVGMRKGMEMMLTGNSIDGIEAEKRGWATAAYPLDKLEDAVVEMASTIAQIPTDIVQINKRLVHRQMDVMGFRTGIRNGTEMCTLGVHQPSFQEFISKTGAGKGKLTSALQERDSKFGDYRTSEEHED